MKSSDAEIAALDKSCMELGFIIYDPPFGVDLALVEKNTHTFLYGYLLQKLLGKGDTLNGSCTTTAAEEDSTNTH